MDKYKEYKNGQLWLRGVIDEKGNPAGPGPEGLRFEHRIVINAPKKVVWEVLSDVNSWGNWSVLYPKAKGKLESGNTIEIDIFVPGTKAIPSKAIIEESIEESMVVFKSVPDKVNEKIMSGVRYFIIEEIDGNHCVVTDGEVVCGYIGIPIAKYISRKG